MDWLNRHAMAMCEHSAAATLSSLGKAWQAGYDRQVERERGSAACWQAGQLPTLRAAGSQHDDGGQEGSECEVNAGCHRKLAQQVEIPGDPAAADM